MPDKVQVDIDELEQRLLKDAKFQHILKFAPKSQRELMTFELSVYIKALLITTIESLKLPEKKEEVLHAGYEYSMTGKEWNDAVDLMETAKQNLIKEIQV